MCHLILLLPILALPVFWLLPAGEDAPLYAVVVVASAAAYWLAMQAMRAPVRTGVAALMHAVGAVRSVDGRKASVWVAGELWSAESVPGALKVGDAVEVVGAEGLMLQVRAIGAGERSAAPADRADGQPQRSGS